MATGYGTSTAEMAQAGRHVLTVNQEVQSELAGLRSSLGPLAGAWQGQASATFTQLMARWDQDARSLSGALEAIGTAIQGSAAAYQQQEDQQAEGMSAIRSALG